MQALAFVLLLYAAILCFAEGHPVDKRDIGWYEKPHHRRFGMPRGHRHGISPPPQKYRRFGDSEESREPEFDRSQGFRHSPLHGFGKPPRHGFRDGERPEEQQEKPRHKPVNDSADEDDEEISDTQAEENTETEEQEYTGEDNEEDDDEGVDDEKESDY